MQHSVAHCWSHSAVWTFTKKRRICVVVLKMTRVVDGFLNAVGKNGGWSQQWIRCAVRSLLHMYYVYMYAALNCLFRKKINQKKNFFHEIAFLAVLNFFPIQKMIFGHFWNCKKWNLVKKNSWNWFIWFHKFFGLEFLKFSSPLW